MERMWFTASLWLILAVAAAVAGRWLRIATALSTFGTISALFGLNRGIIDRAQYSCLVAVVIASAVIPTAIANAWFLPARFRKAQTAPVAHGAAVFEEPS
ncbi:MAG TPA: hypothetical protein VNJ11_16150 [Bryobacteraceae bacterium]|nr:hypothetical protein [Bryobacteraceae bacterium]